MKILKKQKSQPLTMNVLSEKFILYKKLASQYVAAAWGSHETLTFWKHHLPLFNFKLCTYIEVILMWLDFKSVICSCVHLLIVAITFVQILYRRRTILFRNSISF